MHGGYHVSLPYEFLVPCLCIEVCHPLLQLPGPFSVPISVPAGRAGTSLTALLCYPRPPTQTMTVHAASTAPSVTCQLPVSACVNESQVPGVPSAVPLSPLLLCSADGPELWSSVHFHDYSTSSKDQMAMVLSTRCPLHPQATLCWKEMAAEFSPCHDIPNSTASEEEQVKGPSLGVPWGTRLEGCGTMLLTGAPTRPQGPLRAVSWHWGASGLCRLGTVTHYLLVPGIHAG